MYSIGHHTLKLDGIITEFADIYAPLAQIWKNTASESMLEGKGRKFIPVQPKEKHLNSKQKRLVGAISMQINCSPTMFWPDRQVEAP